MRLLQVKEVVLSKTKWRILADPYLRAEIEKDPPTGNQTMMADE